MAYKTLHTGHHGLSDTTVPMTKRGVVSTVLNTLLVWQERSSMRRHLANLDERNLNDIGMTYAQMSDEASKPFWQA